MTLPISTNCRRVVALLGLCLVLPAPAAELTAATTGLFARTVRSMHTRQFGAAPRRTRTSTPAAVEAMT
jgi:hypothetical protein